jgi:hypothetical protein
MTLRSWPVVVALASVAISPALSAQDPLRADAASMQRKLLAIATRGEAKAPRATPVRTSFTDRELNAYFKVAGPDVVPPGIVDPQIAIDDGGRVRARALVDLQTAVKQKERGWTDPLAWLPPGTIEMTAAGTLQSSDGKARLAIDTATLGGVAISKSVLQEVISYYSRTPEHPKGWNLDEPFELPARIRAVETHRGVATVVQQ